METNDKLVVTNYFVWEKFSTLEVIRYKFQTLLLQLLCKVLNSHSWSIEPNEWKFSDINTLEQFRKHCTKKLSCDFCTVCKTYAEVQNDLTDSEIAIYNHQTMQFYNKKK